MIAVGVDECGSGCPNMITRIISVPLSGGPLTRGPSQDLHDNNNTCIIYQ